MEHDWKCKEACEREEYDPNEDRMDYIKRMENEGFKVVIPETYELFIDIDNEDDYALYLSQAKIFFREIQGATSEEHESRNGLPGRHITITLPFNIPDNSRIAWQAALGSDPRRELLSLIRLNRGDLHPTLFVEKQ